MIDGQQHGSETAEYNPGWNLELEAGEGQKKISWQSPHRQRQKIFPERIFRGKDHELEWEKGYGREAGDDQRYEWYLVKPVMGSLIKATRFIFGRIRKVQYGNEEFIIEIGGHESADCSHDGYVPVADEFTVPYQNRLMWEQGDRAIGRYRIEEYYPEGIDLRLGYHHENPDCANQNHSCSESVRPGSHGIDRIFFIFRGQS